MPKEITVCQIVASELRPRLRGVLEDVAFRGVAYRVRVHGAPRAYLLPPPLGERLLQYDALGLVDPHELTRAIKPFIKGLGKGPVDFSDAMRLLKESVLAIRNQS